jgi:lysophospholipase L1-like esterase
MTEFSRRLLLQAGLVSALPVMPSLAQAAPAVSRGLWSASWAASAHGPYPSGNPNAQPDQSFAFPDAQAGARDQSFRMMVRPSLWGRSVRLRFSNAFGTRPLVLDGVFIGLQSFAGNVAPRTNRPVTFGRSRTMTIAPGATGWSDPVALPFVRSVDDPLLAGRRLAVSFHTPGPTGPMTWHAKSLTTSYLTAPGGGARGGDEGDGAFPYTTASWFFLDMVDVATPATVIAGFGDSITDGTNTTLNGDDRWPDVLARRLNARVGARVSVVNAGIGGNRVTGPAEYSPQNPVAGGPSALARMERDVMQLSGLRVVVWLEGINDFAAGATAQQVIAGFQEGIRRLRERRIRVIGATLTTALGAATPAGPLPHGTPEVESQRQALNAWIRAPGNFDAVVDFDAATRDPASGRLKAPFIPNSTVGGAGDLLHPNRAGLQAMGEAVDLAALNVLGPARR